MTAMISPSQIVTIAHKRRGMGRPSAHSGHGGFNIGQELHFVAVRCDSALQEERGRLFGMASPSVFQYQENATGGLGDLDYVKSLAELLRSKGGGVNGVAPGPVDAAEAAASKSGGVEHLQGPSALAFDAHGKSFSTRIPCTSLSL
jgi:hypothetical protein